MINVHTVPSENVQFVAGRHSVVPARDTVTDLPRNFNAAAWSRMHGRRMTKV